MIGKAKVLKKKNTMETVTVNVGSDDGNVSGYEVTITKRETVGVKEKYTRLEYIEGTGSQFLDTGFIPNQDTRVVLDAVIPNKQEMHLFGARETSSSKRFSMVIPNGYALRSDYNANQVNISNDPGLTSRFVMDKNKNVTSFNGTVIATHTYATFNANCSMYLFAINTNGSYGSMTRMIVYSCKIYDNGTLVRDYIPAMNDSGVAGLYDAVNDTFTISSCSSDFLAGAKNEEVVATQTSATGTYKIPFGQGYTIKASDVSGYITPSAQTFVASENRRVVDVTYTKIVHDGTTEPTNGIWIQDTDGYCHTVDEWTGEYTPNGIAVVTSNCRFVMALQDAYTYCEWGSYGTTVSNIVTTTDEATAKADYAGESNTTTILNQLGNSSSTDDAPPAYYCRAFTFPNGNVGYMGAAGEWQAALDNKAAINTALSKVGGTAMGYYYWTSTQADSTSSWSTWWVDDRVTYEIKYAECYARAFATL